MKYWAMVFGIPLAILMTVFLCIGFYDYGRGDRAPIVPSGLCVESIPVPQSDNETMLMKVEQGTLQNGVIICNHGTWVPTSPYTGS